MKPTILSILLFVFFPLNTWATNWFVDNYANGLNSGQSWQDAWESFADINWGNVDPGDTIYISGGSTSKSYFETLFIGQSGTSGKLITITKGMQQNHNGTVIIDGQWSRKQGVYSGGWDYFKVTKLKLQDHAGQDGSFSIRSGDGVIIDNNTVDHASTWGIYVADCTNTTISNNYFYTGYVSYNVETDGIFIAWGSDNIVDGNTIVIANKNSSYHMDPIQALEETRLTVRNNYCELVADRTNSACQGMILQRIYGWLKVYNNVVLGSSYQRWQALLIDQNNDSSTGTVYAWNNTVIAQHPSGIACRFANTPPSNIGAIKNNICITDDYYAIMIDKGVDDPSKVDFNLYDNDYLYVGSVGNQKSWDEWQNAGFDVHGMNQNSSLDQNFRPDSVNDPPVNGGIPINDFSFDKDGIYRPQYSAWDIGAYEFYIGSPTPPPGSESSSGGGCFVSSIDEQNRMGRLSILCVLMIIAGLNLIAYFGRNYKR